MFTDAKAHALCVSEQCTVGFFNEQSLSKSVLRVNQQLDISIAELPTLSGNDRCWSFKQFKHISLFQ
jgi:hypothetical protein